jgi:hypothetical protein
MGNLDLMHDQKILELSEISRKPMIYINRVGAKLNSFSSLYVKDIFMSGSYESFLILYVTYIFLSGSLSDILICRWHIMNGQVGINKY